MVIVLFGMNAFSKKFISKNPKEDIMVVDNKKAGTRFDIDGQEYIVCRPDIIHSIEEKHILITAASKNGKKEIAEQLEYMGYKYLSDYSFIEDDVIEIGTTYWETLLDSNVLMENGKFMPQTLHLGLTDVCNLKCRFCGFHGMNTLCNDIGHFMQENVVDQIAMQASRISSLKKLYFTHDGEDFLHKDWNLIANKILKANKNIREFQIYTNGMLLNNENIEKLRSIEVEKIKLVVSIDGNTAAENDYFRCNSDYSTIYKNIKNAVKLLEDREVSFFINNNHIINEKILEQNNYVFKPYRQPIPQYLLDDFEEMGIQILAGPTLFLQPKEAGYPDIDNYRLVQAKKNSTDIGCFNPYELLSINAKGDILFCGCNVTQDIVANVLEEDMLEVWKNNLLLVNARKSILNGITPKLCSNCSSKINGEFTVICR